MSNFFGFFDTSGRGVDWFDMLKLPEVFDRLGLRVDLIDRSNSGENEERKPRTVPKQAGAHLSHGPWGNYEGVNGRDIQRDPHGGRAVPGAHSLHACDREARRGPDRLTARIVMDPAKAKIGMKVKSVSRRIATDGDSGIIHYGTKFVPVE